MFALRQALTTASETPERLWTGAMATATAEELAHVTAQARAAQVCATPGSFLHATGSSLAEGQGLAQADPDTYAEHVMVHQSWQRTNMLRWGARRAAADATSMWICYASTYPPVQATCCVGPWLQQ